MDLRTVAALAALTTVAACSDAPASADSRTPEETVAFIVFGLDNEGDFDTGRGKVTVTKEKGPPLVLTMADAASDKPGLEFTTTQTNNCNYVVGFGFPNGDAVKVAVDFTNLTSAKIIVDQTVQLVGAAKHCIQPPANFADRCGEIANRNTFPLRVGPLDAKNRENKAAHQSRLDEAVKYFREKICIAKG